MRKFKTKLQLPTQNEHIIVLQKKTIAVKNGITSGLNPASTKPFVDLKYNWS